MRESDLDTGLAQLFFNSEIQIAPVTPRSGAHVAAPNHQLQLDGVVAEFVQKNAGRRIIQRVGIFLGGREQGLTRFLQVASVSDSDGDSETNARIAISPVGDRRVYELRVRHDHGDVVVRANHCASGANLLHLTADAGDIDPIADCDRSLGQNDQTANEIAGDVLEAKPDADTDGAREHSQRAEMDSSVIEHDEEPDDQDNVADDLRDGVLQRAINSAFREKTVVEKMFRLGGKPKHPDEQRDEQENLDQADLDSGDGRVPRKRNAGGVDRAHHEKDEHGKAQDRGRDRDEIFVDLKTGEKTADGIALHHPRDDEPGGNEDRKRDQAEDRDVLVEGMEKRLLNRTQIKLRH